MKKLSAILLLTIFMFNTIGYKLWMQFAVGVANTKLEARLDDGNYSDADLLEMKIPLRLPYNNNWSDFERVNGEITVEGITYKYVKQKVYNDTLIVLCIPHESKKLIQHNAADYFGKVNGAPAGSESSKKAEIFKKQLSDYDYDEDVANMSLYVHINKPALYAAGILQQQYIATPWQPPDFNC
ncbi:MAG TPA: hypothetical protein PL045_07130 [Chitinophagaceae bacterium]|nr:hypothetical protein [Chitinophagaceae bacterium]